MNRYQRNILIDGLGEKGQAALKAAKVLVIGAGGIGSPVLFYLAAAGVGTIGIMDSDVVEITNLQRQIIHSTKDLGEQKVVSAKHKLQELNPDVDIVTYNERLAEENAGDIISNYDFVVDCCDNTATKYLINDVCVQLKKPYSHGAVTAMQGEVMTYVPGHCNYRDAFVNPSDDESLSSSRIGILGAVAGLIGTIQATEVVKYFTSIGTLLLDKILIYDAKTMTFRTFKLSAGIGRP